MLPILLGLLIGQVAATNLTSVQVTSTLAYVNLQVQSAQSSPGETVRCIFHSTTGAFSAASLWNSLPNNAIQYLTTSVVTFSRNVFPEQDMWAPGVYQFVSCAQSNITDINTTSSEFQDNSSPVIEAEMTPYIVDTYAPTSAPTEAPTASPTETPTGSPTLEPTNSPTSSPTLTREERDRCRNGLLDGNETDIDCGDICDECRVGERCEVDADCGSGDCFFRQCSVDQFQCSNRLKDADETDLDCGGKSCPPCYNLQECKDDSDCLRENGRIFHCLGDVCLDECRWRVKLALGDNVEREPGLCSSASGSQTGIPGFFNETLGSPITPERFDQVMRPKFLAPAGTVCTAECKTSLETAWTACEYFFKPEEQIAGLGAYQNVLDQFMEKCSVSKPAPKEAPQPRIGSGVSHTQASMFLFTSLAMMLL